MKMNKKTKKVFLLAILKGFLHALIIPIILMFLMLTITHSLWAFLTPFIWIMLATAIYIKAEDKDISAMVFFGTLKFLLVIALVFLLMIAS